MTQPVIAWRLAFCARASCAKTVTLHPKSTKLQQHQAVLALKMVHGRLQSEHQQQQCLLFPSGVGCWHQQQQVVLMGPNLWSSSSHATTPLCRYFSALSKANVVSAFLDGIFAPLHQ